MACSSCYWAPEIPRAPQTLAAEGPNGAFALAVGSQLAEGQSWAPGQDPPGHQSPGLPQPAVPPSRARARSPGASGEGSIVPGPRPHWSCHCPSSSRHSHCGPEHPLLRPHPCPADLFSRQFWALLMAVTSVPSQRLWKSQISFLRFALRLERLGLEDRLLRRATEGQGHQAPAELSGNTGHRPSARANAP